MVGGNDSTEKMIHREIPRVLVLRPLATTRCSEHCSGDLSLDNAFALIEGHPNSSSGFTSGPPALVRRDRNIQRTRQGGRVQNSPDTKQEQAIFASLDDETPFLMLFHQNGSKEQGWRDCPFWWPVLQIPRKTKTTIFASEMIEVE